MSEELNKTQHMPEHGDAHKHSGSQPLLGGNELIHMLESIIPMLSGLGTDEMSGKSGCGCSHGHDADAGGENPFEVLEDGDFDSADPVVEHFKNDLGGTKGVVKIIKIDGPKATEKLHHMATTLKGVRVASNLQALRHTFSSIQAVIKGVGAENQLQAVKHLDVLIRRTSGTDRDTLVKARTAVLAGTPEMLDAASYRVRSIFSSHVPVQNVRTAYTTLNTQQGEGYQICPKAKFQIGHAVPMELSKCRDNCIDSRVAADGRVACAYSEWVKVAMDTHQAAVEDRLEVVARADDKSNSLNLKAGERSKPLTDVERSMEQRLDDKKSGRVGDEKLQKEPNTEGRLDKAKESNLGHHGEPKGEGEETRPQALHDKEKDAKYEGANEKSKKVEDPAKYEGASAKREAAKNGKKPGAKLDPNSEDGLGKQLEKGHGDTDYDEQMERTLEEARDPFTDEEYETLLEELLKDHRAED